MKDVLTAVVMMSASGTFLYILLLAMRPLTERRFDARWHYRMGALVLLFLLVPFAVFGGRLYGRVLTNAGLELPALSTAINDVITYPEADNVYLPANNDGFAAPSARPVQNAAGQSGGLDETQQDASGVTATVGKGLGLRNILGYLPGVWLAGAGVFLAAGVIRQIRFQRKMKRTNLSVEDEKTLDQLKTCRQALKIRRPMKLVSNSLVSSPMLTGIFNSVLILPEVALDDHELRVILYHELTHLKRRDIWLKLLAFVANGVHWFNPAAYVLRRELDAYCELSCDEQVVSGMDEAQRRFYGRTILNVLGRSAGCADGLLTAFAAPLQGLKKRLERIMDYRRPARRAAALSLALAFSLTLVAMTASCMIGAESEETTTQAYGDEQLAPSAAETEGASTSPEPGLTTDVVSMIAPYSDVRQFPGLYVRNEENLVTSAGNFSPDDIMTFWFNEDTEFPGYESLAAEVLENGKNPGLGVRELNARGITGAGVNVAIIDQNLAQPFHPEFADNIAAYTDVGTGQAENRGSMHGPAVASLLVGQTCGVAPDAELYYAAAPSWTRDSAYYADALRWIIDVNRTLPADDKIRVVSISGAPSGEGSPFEENLEMWDAAVAEAQAEGILVLDCRIGYDTGIITPGYYDPSAPEDVTGFTVGYPNVEAGRMFTDTIYVPTSFRSTAEAYSPDHNTFQYTGQGGLSCGIPYAAGVLALGWQVDPSLTNDEIVTLLFDSAYTDGDGNKIIDPPAFIAAIESR